MGAVADKAGMPAVSIIATEFAGQERAGAQVVDLPSVAVARIPHQVLSGEVKDVQPYCEAATEEIIEGLTKWQPKLESTEHSTKHLEFDGKNYSEAAKKMNAFLFSFSNLLFNFTALFKNC